MTGKRLSLKHKESAYIILITLIITATFFFAVTAVHGQQDPIWKILEDGLQDDQETTSPVPAPARGPAGKTKKALACQEGWECVLAGRIVKEDYDKVRAEIDVGALTGDRGFDRISLRQTIKETHGAILNTVKVGGPGKWKSYDQGIRLPAGRTQLDIPVPAGTPKVVFSLDHGRGARVRVVLERRLP